MAGVSGGDGITTATATPKLRSRKGGAAVPLDDTDKRLMNLLQSSFPLEAEPFARRVTTLLMQSLEALAQAAETTKTDGLLDPARNPGLSANLCESLLLLRPTGDRARLTISADWARAWLPPSREPGRQVQLAQSAFNLAEVVAPQLRTMAQSQPMRFIGFVDALRGQPSRGHGAGAQTRPRRSVHGRGGQRRGDLLDGTR